MELMKNGLAKPAVMRIAKALNKVVQGFSEDDFIEQCLVDLEQRELKQRVQHFIGVMHQFMPDDFTLAAPLLIKLKPHWDHGDENDALRSFAAWPLVDYVAEYGLAHAEISLNVLKELTSLFSAEFAIRPFIVKYPQLCQQSFLLWATDKSEDIRRLVSEGTRPKLPWGMQLNCFVEDPTPNIILLTMLKNDPSLYVRRSVANHLNDISKDHPHIVINTCKQWQQEIKALNNNGIDQNAQNQKNMHWLIKHATRTLIKASYSDAFGLLGFTDKPQITVSNLNLSSKSIAIGDSLNFDFELKSTSSQQQKLVIDFIIHFVKANGKQRGKVFKLKNITLKADQRLTLTKKHSFKIISTRKYYIGEHSVEILINGKSMGKINFILTKG